MAWEQKEYPRCEICNCPVTENPHSINKRIICNECYIKHYDEYQKNPSSNFPAISLSEIHLKENPKKDLPAGMSKIVITNICGALVGSLILYFSFPLILEIFSFLFQIPVINSILSFGMTFEYGILPYSALLSSGLSLLTCHFISKPTKKNKRFGSCGLGIYMFIQYLIMIISLFNYNGFHYEFIAFAFVALGISVFTFLYGLYEH